LNPPSQFPHRPPGGSLDEAGTVHGPVDAATVLVVEDHPDSAEVMAEILRSWGYHVTVCSSVGAAIDAARAAPPDVVLSDLGLPGRDGFDLAQTFTGDHRLAAIPLVAVTSFVSPAARRSAAHAGFVEVLTKPVDPERLQRLLANLLGARIDPPH
jgi:CheY-like chemotaxis protein